MNSLIAHIHGFGERDMSPRHTDQEVESMKAELLKLKDDLKLSNLKVETLLRQLVAERLRNGKLENMVMRMKANV